MMKTLIGLALIAMVTASAAWAASSPPVTSTVIVSGSTPPPTVGTYYIAEGGSDSYDGTTPSVQLIGGVTHGPWASPNHTLNCSATGGDIIKVQPGTYPSNLFYLRFGPPGNGCQPGTFRTLKCDGSNLHACIITDAYSPGYSPLVVGTPYWIVQGFEAVGDANNGDGCLGSDYFPQYGSQYNGHHVVFINNYVHDCQTGSAVQDYGAIIGFISYHSAYGANQSGISSYELTPYDSNTNDTRVFVVGAFIFKAQNGPGSTDGEGFIFDDWDHTQSDKVPYTGKGVIEQSMFIGNGSDGVESFSGWSSRHYLLSSTAYGNARDTQSCSNALGEVLTDSSNLVIYHDILVSNKATNTHWCWIETAPGSGNYVQTQQPSFNVYALVCGYCNASSFVTYTDYFGVNGQHYFGYHHAEAPGYDYSFGAGNVQDDPVFTNPVIPTTAPDCSLSSTVVQCMATVINNFTTHNPAVAEMGYKPPANCAPDPYWPTWIPVNVIPDGIVTKPCN
jgi:hypothetical protein